MRDLLRQSVYLGLAALTVAAVWAAAANPPGPCPTYITSDGKLCDGPPPRRPERSTQVQEVHLSLDAALLPEGPVAAAAVR